MDLSQTFKRLADECQRHCSWYRNATQGHPVLGRYASPAEVVDVLIAASRPMRERNALVFALVSAQRSAPHLVWHAILILAFAPMLQRLRSAVRGCSGQELDQQILALFLESVVGLGANSDRIAMHLRQRTERALFLAIRRQTAYRRRTCGALALDSLITEPPEPCSAVGRPDDPLLSAALQAMDRGALRALVRQRHPEAAPKELERTYRRLQRQRSRFLEALRLRALDSKRPPRIGGVKGRCA
jgi:hypothetical protein